MCLCGVWLLVDLLNVFKWVNIKDPSRLIVDTVYLWREWMFGIIPSKGRKGLLKRQRLPTFDQHCVKSQWSNSQSVVMTKDHESGHDVYLVTCKARHIGQATAQTSTSSFTASAHDHGPRTWWWKGLIPMEA